jgi:hypothetical protein
MRMAYTVVWMRGPMAMGTEAFEELDTAVAHAQEMIDQMQNRFGATSVKIVDAEGTAHFLRSISRH